MKKVMVTITAAPKVRKKDDAPERRIKPLKAIEVIRVLPLKEMQEEWKKIERYSQEDYDFYMDAYKKRKVKENDLCFSYLPDAEVEKIASAGLKYQGEEKVWFFNSLNTPDSAKLPIYKKGGKLYTLYSVWSATCN